MKIYLNRRIKLKMSDEINSNLKKEVLSRDAFTCQKCGFIDKNSKDLKIRHIKPRVCEDHNPLQNLITLCSICYGHSPDDENDFKRYLGEKIDGRVLNTFRRPSNSISGKTKQGMENYFKKGKHITKAPRGYKILNKQLIPDENSRSEIISIFKEYLDAEISLTKLAKNHRMTTAGIIKLLKNTTYLGKVKFANTEINGEHEPIIEKQLFESVQKKLGQK